MHLCRAASLECGWGALAQQRAEPTKSIYRFAKISVLPSYETIPVVNPTNLDLPNLNISYSDTDTIDTKIVTKIISARRGTLRYFCKLSTMLSCCVHGPPPLLVIFILTYGQ